MLSQLQQGVSLVVDRYAYSGVAYTSAKVCWKTPASPQTTPLPHLTFPTCPSGPGHGMVQNSRPRPADA